MIDQQIDISTKDGKTTTFISHPERGGPFPIIIFYMDAPAIREELRDMARLAREENEALKLRIAALEARLGAAAAAPAGSAGPDVAI